MNTLGRSLLLSTALATLAGAVTVSPAAAQSLTEDQVAMFRYRSIGPTRQSGRFVEIAVPTDDPHTFYIATASGHLWKTENRGITFDILFDDQDVFSIGAIAGAVRGASARRYSFHSVGAILASVKPSARR